jgi:hypothetical protein
MSAGERQYSRLTYLAYGEMPDDRRAIVHERCERFHAALQAGRAPEDAAMAFPADAREPAMRAAVAVRAFEAAIGQKTGAYPSHIYRPQTQPWYPRPTDGRYTYTVSSFCVGIQVHFTGSKAAEDAAIAAAKALADLLVALGATDVQSTSID